MDGLYRASGIVKGAPVVCGFVVRNGIIVRAAPYLRWFIIRRNVEKVLHRFSKLSNWTVEYLG